MTLAEYLEKHPDPSEREIRVALSGNLCRCTGYAEIVDAALEAAREMRAQVAAR
jgi:carbon-monoxide dehydrogenase small subunit